MCYIWTYKVDYTGYLHNLQVYERGRSDRQSDSNLLADVIKRIRNGETPEKIIASGVSTQTVEKAEDVVSLFS